MEISALQLVRVAANKGTRVFTEQQLTQIAVAITRGGGAVRLEGNGVCVVLPSPRNSDDGGVPIAMFGRLKTIKNSPRPAVRRTGAVANELRDITRGLPPRNARPQGYKGTWAPRAQHSFSQEPLAGTLGPVVGESPDITTADNRYVWYDLAEIAVGGHVYRRDSQGKSTFHQCVDCDQWVTVHAGKLLLDFAAIVAALGVLTQEVTLTEPPEASELPLLYTPKLSATP